MIHAAHVVLLLLAFTNTTEAIIGLNWGTISYQRLLPSQVVDLILQNGIRHARIFATEIDQLAAFAGSRINLTMGISDSTVFAESLDAARAWVTWKDEFFISSNARRVILGTTVFSSGIEDKKYLNRSINCLTNVQTALNEAGFGYLKATFQHDIKVLKANITKPSEAEFRDEIKEEMTDVVRFLQLNKSPYVLHMFPISDVVWNEFDLSYAFLDNQSTFVVNDTNGLKYTNMFEFTYDSFVWALYKLNASDLHIVVGQVGWPTDGYPGANATAAERYFKGLLPFIASKKGTPMRPGEDLEVFIHAVADEPKMPYSDPFTRHWGIYRSNGQPKYKIDLSGRGRDVYPKEVKGIMRMPQRWCVLKENTTDIEKALSQQDLACKSADCTSFSPGGSCSGLSPEQKISCCSNFICKTTSSDPECCHNSCVSAIDLGHVHLSFCNSNLHLYHPVSNHLSKKQNTQHRAWKTNNIIQRDFSVFFPNCLKKKFTRVPSFVPVNKPDLGSNLGSRCRGQGTIPASCGSESRKLRTCGAKNMRSVSLKWPKIPATAMVIPAK